MGKKYVRATSCFPSGRYFSKGHAWLRKNPYGLIKVGTDNFLMDFLKEIIIYCVTAIDFFIKKNNFIYQTSSLKESLRFKLPVKGILKFINTGIQEKKISDPFESNWQALIPVKNFIDAKKFLLNEIEYEKWIETKPRGFYNFFPSQHSLIDAETTAAFQVIIHISFRRSWESCIKMRSKYLCDKRNFKK